MEYLLAKNLLTLAQAIPRFRFDVLFSTRENQQFIIQCPTDAAMTRDESGRSRRSVNPAPINWG
jgi:hypothetical protein